VYLASADWMTRNLDKRIELLFPIEDPAAAAKVVAAFDAMLRDTAKGRRLHANGDWRLPLPLPDSPPFDAQTFLHEQAQGTSGEESGTSFAPIERPHLTPSSTR